VDALEQIDRRYSCRLYSDRTLSGEHREALAAVMAERSTGPLGSAVRFGLIAATPGDASALRRLGTYGFIEGATAYIVGAVRKGPKDLEDFGCLLEEVILHATALGVATCWLGGSFTRTSFTSRFGGVARDEIMPAVVAAGYPADDGGVARIRARTEGTRRFPPSELFFREEFGRPLDLADAGGYPDALHAVRMAPSATNKQPWRIVRLGDDWHFYLVRTRWYGRRSPFFLLLRIADLQRVDLGIAMCHFALVARQGGLPGRWVVDDPGAATPGPGVEYVVTWRAGA